MREQRVVIARLLIQYLIAVCVISVFGYTALLASRKITSGLTGLTGTKGGNLAGALAPSARPSKKYPAGWSPDLMEQDPPKESAMKIASEREAVGDLMLQQGEEAWAANAYQLAAEAAFKLVDDVRLTVSSPARDETARLLLKVAMARSAETSFSAGFEMMEKAVGFGATPDALTSEPLLLKIGKREPARFEALLDKAKKQQSEIAAFLEKESQKAANAEAAPAP
jgi:hypothetical protein